VAAMVRFLHSSSRRISLTTHPAQACSSLVPWGNSSPHRSALSLCTKRATSLGVLTSPRSIARHSAWPVASRIALRLDHGMGQATAASRSCAIAQR